MTMSRSGYVEDSDGLNFYRANVDRALAGKRGQAFLREMAAALDAMPVKALVAGEILRDNEHVCAIGSVALARMLDVSTLDVEDGDAVGKAFGIKRMLACEIVYENDEGGPKPWWNGGPETPEQRWTRMRAWVTDHLRPPPSTETDLRETANG
jgi:hypothetical protein